MVRMTERPAGFGKPQTTLASGERHNTARPRCRWIAWLRRRRGPDLHSCRPDADHSLCSLSAFMRARITIDLRFDGNAPRLPLLVRVFAVLVAQLLSELL